MVVGKSLVRTDAAAKVRGGAIYGVDVRFGGMLVGKTLRAGIPHAGIVNLDTSAAAKTLILPAPISAPCTLVSASGAPSPRPPPLLAARAKRRQRPDRRRRTRTSYRSQGRWFKSNPRNQRTAPVRNRFRGLAVL